MSAAPGTSDAIPLFARQLSRRQLVVADLGIAFVLAVVLPVLASESDQAPLWNAPAVVDVAVHIAATVPVALRRLWPVPVLAVLVTADAMALPLDVPLYGFVGTALAAYSVAMTIPTPRWLPTATGILAIVGGLLSVVGGARPQAAQLGADVVIGLVVVAGAWALGRSVRDRRELSERAARRLAETQVAAERLRIARELHDVVAHGLSLIAVKSAVANHVASTHPQEARRALGVIEETSKTALTEMRQIVGVLRSDEPQTASLRPMPGLDDVPALVTRAEQAGVALTVTIPARCGIPEGVELTAYRIIQEAVTNVIKHAAPASCRATVDIGDGVVEVSIVDDGPPQPLPPHVQGHGLVGMQERVAVYGGQFSAGPRPGGGFAVSARIPYRHGDSVEENS